MNATDLRRAKGALVDRPLIGFAKSHDSNITLTRLTGARIGIVKTLERDEDGTDRSAASAG